MVDNPRIEELRRRVQKDPASIAFAQLAEEYRRAGEHDEAVRVCRAGLERHPTYLSARVTLGRALIELEQYDEAKAELEQVLRSAPENLAAIRGLADIHQRRGELDEALKQYQTALGIAKHDPDLEESVHDLSRQLGGAHAAVQSTTPQPSNELPDLIPAVPELETFGTRSSDAPATSPSTPAASPELEAATDEFTKALQALESLSFDLPMPAAQSPAPAVEALLDANDAHRDTREADVDFAAVVDEPARQDQPVVAEMSGNVATDAMSPADVAVKDELESWLDAIVLDRDDRAK